ncbi:protein LSM12 homolog [Exaiptasia diaphana]|uniref:AD domain-containing protein n=1 Tax=Exaiptasia diaphana TaxID=2652724 RepID=A0A913Y9U5_EXADI|nr:protein LSM12 homolog [Exaiptasia diaphana]KXJ28217.1 Protein LSM12-like [Exaiptasia diaphana]
MATGDGGRVRDGKEIPPGSIVSCTTKFDEKYQGEVIAFDYSTKFVVIKTDATTETKKGNSDVKIFNISYLKNFEIIKESTTKTVKSLSALDLEKIDRRCRAKVNEKMQAVNRVGVDVTPEGQKLYDMLAKQFSELQWNDKNIVVMNSVVIKPPYSTESIYTEGKDENAFNYIRGIVNRHHCKNESES